MHIHSGKWVSYPPDRSRRPKAVDGRVWIDFVSSLESLLTVRVRRPYRGGGAAEPARTPQETRQP